MLCGNVGYIFVCWPEYFYITFCYATQSLFVMLFNITIISPMICVALPWIMSYDIWLQYCTTLIICLVICCHGNILSVFHFTSKCSKCIYCHAILPSVFLSACMFWLILCRLNNTIWSQFKHIFIYFTKGPK